MTIRRTKVSNDDPQLAAALKKMLDDLTAMLPGLSPLVERLRYAIQIGDSNGAAILGIRIGRGLAMKTEIEPLLPSVNRHIKQLVSLDRIHADPQIRRLHRRINAAIADGIKKRAGGKQPSLTAIRQRVANTFGVSYRQVLRIQKEARQTTKRKNR